MRRGKGGGYLDEWTGQTQRGRTTEQAQSATSCHPYIRRSPVVYLKHAQPSSNAKPR